MENVWTSKKLAKTLLGIKFEEALEGPENIIAGTNISLISSIQATCKDLTTFGTSMKTSLTC